MKRAFLAMALALLACERSPTTIQDTEGRVFSMTCKGDTCTLTQTDGPKSGAARHQLLTNTRVIAICDASNPGIAPPPDSCRPVACSTDRDCPLLDNEKAQATCKRSVCTNPGKKLRVNDAVGLCLAGTGIGHRTAKQAERYALGLSCGSPCVVPAACR